MRMAFSALEATLTEASVDLAVGRSTLHKMLKSEAGFQDVSSMTAKRIENAFVAKGVEFGEGGWVRLKDKEK